MKEYILLKAREANSKPNKMKIKRKGKKVKVKAKRAR